MSPLIFVIYQMKAEDVLIVMESPASHIQIRIRSQHYYLRHIIVIYGTFCLQIIFTRMYVFCHLQ